MNNQEVTAAQLRQAAGLKDRIAGLEKQLTAILGASTAPKSAKPGKRKMSPAHIAKIRAAQKLRWAKFHAAQARTAAKPAKKGGMSAAGKARIAAAQKARWAKIKAAKK